MSKQENKAASLAEEEAPVPRRMRPGGIECRLGLLLGLAGLVASRLGQLWIEFDVYPQSSCGSGTPIATPRAQVADTGAVGDGVGTANTVYTSLSEASYCVVAIV